MLPVAGTALLSPEVLARVLRYAAGDSDCTMAEWRDQQLPLLSVCRQWRALIGPHVLGQVFISLEENGPADPASAADADGEPEDMRIATNVGIAVAGGRHASVKSLDIRTEDPKGITAFVGRAVQMLGARALAWGGIDTLRVSFLLDELAIDAGRPDTDVEAQVTQVCKELARLVPNIARLEITGPSRSAECALVAGRLVDTYAQQLRHVDISLPVPLASPEFSSRLEHLALELDADMEAQLPHVHAPSLRYLSLSSASGGAVWRWFQGAGQDVTFSKLKRLAISFASDGERQGDGAGSGDPLDMLRFPELETLSVGMCPAAGELLSRAAFPDTLKTLRVVGPLAGTVTLTDAAFDAATRTSICKHIAGAAAGKGDALYTPNFFFGPASTAAAHATLHIGGTARVPDDAAVQWPGLAELHIDSRVCAKTLLAMLPGLTALSVLRAPDVVVSDAAAARSIYLRAGHKSHPGKVAAAATAMLAQ